jgi:antitoxin VapB
MFSKCSIVRLTSLSMRDAFDMYTSMALHIRDPEADRLARELAARTSQPTLRDQLKREQARTTFPRLKDEIMAISRRTAALPRRTGRTADEILDYDERGLPR